ncbi:MAG TPA: VWA domain-containing protein [Gaiellaceae bacterium]
MPQADGVVGHVVTFGRVLRQAGLEVGPGRIADGLRGLDQVDLTRRDDVYWTLRANFVTRHDELAIFDRAFDAWFLRAPHSPFEVPPPPQATVLRPVHSGERAQEGNGADDSPAARGWSYEEILRKKDFGAMTPDELHQVRRLIAEIAAERPRRRSRRLRRHHRGRELDLRRTIRESLEAAGDPVHRQYRLRVRVPRKLVVLCDVSGSMEAYVRPLLLFVHAVRGSGKGVEAFAFGTRLTRLTPALETSDPDRALQEASRSVADWCGGTRIGASLKAYNDDWGRRALTRGAVVLIASDGWEREEAGSGLLEEQMARLARQAYTVVWMNPLKGHPEYEPLAAGMRAALPHVDRFLPGHNLASLEQLGEVLMGIERRHAA